MISRAFFVWAIGLLALVNASSGDPGYEIISLTHHIKGEIAGETGYDKSGPSPLSDSFSNSIGEVGSRTEISSWYEFDVFFCMAGVLDADMGDDPDPDASSIAEISMIFRPYGNSFEIHTTLYDEWWGARSYVSPTFSLEGVKGGL